MKPISPKEAKAAKQTSIPPYVIEAFNELIVENLSMCGVAVVRQDEALKRIMAKVKKLPENEQVTRDAIFDRGWMDVEPLFRAAGWRVEYDKPAYNETYEPTYEFSKRGS